MMVMACGTCETFAAMLHIRRCIKKGIKGLAHGCTLLTLLAQYSVLNKLLPPEQALAACKRLLAATFVNDLAFEGRTCFAQVYSMLHTGAHPLAALLLLW